MASKNKLKYLFILGVLIAAGFALADSLGFFNPKPYTAVNHGSHNYYVPDNRENDYVPPGREKEIVANTGLTAYGETVEVTFTAPEEAGRYEFLCSFMAHFSAGMRGKLIAQS